MEKGFLRIIGVLIFITILYKINVLRIIPILKNVDLYLLGISIFLVLPLMSVKAARWSSLLLMQDIHYPLKDAISVYLASYYIGLVTPGRLGDFIKVLYLKRGRAIPYGKAFVSALMDRLFDLLLIVMVGITGISSFGLFNRFGYTSFGLLALMILLLGSLFNNKILDRILRNVYKTLSRRWRDRVQLHFNDFAVDINKLKNIKLSLPLLLTIVAYCITFLQCYLMALALHMGLSFFYIAFTVSIAGLVALLPISFAGIGTRDVTVIFLFGLMGIGPQEAVSFSLLYLTVFVFVIGLWGAVYWLRKPLKVKE